MVDGLQSGWRINSVGVTGSGKTYTIANLIQQVQRPALVLAHTRPWRRSCMASFASSFPTTQWNISCQYYDYYQPEALRAVIGYVH